MSFKNADLKKSSRCHWLPVRMEHCMLLTEYSGHLVLVPPNSLMTFYFGPSTLNHLLGVTIICLDCIFIVRWINFSDKIYWVLWSQHFILYVFYPLKWEPLFFRIYLRIICKIFWISLVRIFPMFLDLCVTNKTFILPQVQWLGVSEMFEVCYKFWIWKFGCSHSQLMLLLTSSSSPLMRVQWNLLLSIVSGLSIYEHFSHPVKQ